MNLCKFVVDHKITCKSACLNKKEGKIRPVKIVFPDTIVKTCFVKNLNKFKNPPDQFKNFSINHDRTVDKWKNERLLQDISNEKKTFHQMKIQKTSFCSKRFALGHESCKNKTQDISVSITSKNKQLKISFINCNVLAFQNSRNSVKGLLQIAPTLFTRSLIKELQSYIQSSRI